MTKVPETAKNSLMELNLEQIKQAKKRIDPIILQTVFTHSSSCSERLETEAYLKYENQQLTGSFKIRGALNKMLQMSDADKKKGVIAASAGNHAQGVAYGAKHIGIPATIVMPVHSPIVKIENTKALGADVILHGEAWDESFAYAKELEKKRDLTFVHPFEDSLVIEGQSTIGLEIMEQAPDLDSIIVPIGGGGLISGIAQAVKLINPKTQVYGAVTEAFPGMSNLFHKQDVKKDFYGQSIADGIAVKRPSQFMFDNYISKFVDDIVPVGENEIAESIVFLLEKTKTIVEGSGAVGLAAATKAKDKWNLGKCAIVLCGGNIDLNLISRIIERGLRKAGRIARIEVITPDSPGMLSQLTEIISRLGSNVLYVNHERLDPRLGVRETAINFLLETRNLQHRLEIIQALEKANFKVIN